MANVFLTPKQVANAGIAALESQQVLGATVWRDAEADFGGQVGDTVTVRIEGIAGEARTFNRALGQPIVIDDLQETPVDVKLNNYLYKGVALPDEQLTLAVRDYTLQVATPQAKAVSRGIENLIAGNMNALVSGITLKADGSDVHTAMVEARRRLNKAGVPFDGRYFAVSPEVEAMLLNDNAKKLLPADVSGSPLALREAVIGRLYGFTVVPSNAIAAGSAVAYHGTAFPMATRALVVPAGAAFGQSMTYNGYALRLVRDYDAAFQQDRSVVSTLTGVSTTLDAGAVSRALRLTTAAS